MKNKCNRLYHDDKNARRIVGGPFSSFTAPVTIVTDRLKADGLSRPQIAVRLRRWAMARADVLRIVLGHTGQHYTIAALLRDPTYEDICETQRHLTQLASLLDERPCKVYAFGPAYAHASVFTAFGHLIVHDITAPTHTQSHQPNHHIPPST